MADREVFVDTSGLYALVDKRDAVHVLARQTVAALASRGSKLVVTDFVIDEAMTLAHARSGGAVAVRILDLVEQSVGIRVERIDVTRFDVTKAYFRKHVDQAFSFTDCSSFVVMRELRIRKALTTDGHFVGAGFVALLPVP